MSISNKKISKKMLSYYTHKAMLCAFYNYTMDQPNKFYNWILTLAFALRHSIPSVYNPSIGPPTTLKTVREACRIPPSFSTTYVKNIHNRPYVKAKYKEKREK